MRTHSARVAFYPACARGYKFLVAADKEFILAVAISEHATMCISRHDMLVYNRALLLGKGMPATQLDKTKL